MEPDRIRPEPDDAERKAILEALAAERAERRSSSGWADAALPEHGGDDREP